ncbi:hypothetical protein [Kocuria rosea]|uniref:hypothetical protein n=1 Tax=Kocuria rosea TaxID=1275 RepID=UPI0011A225C0|nr:hypothetical protein [Kocuria rosea]
MLTTLSTSLSKRDIADIVFQQHEDDGDPVSKSQAGRIADKIIRGTFKPNPALARAIGYSDRCGENAVNNVMHEGIEHYVPRYF